MKPALQGMGSDLLTGCSYASIAELTGKSHSIAVIVPQMNCELAQLICILQIVGGIKEPSLRAYV